MHLYLMRHGNAEPGGRMADHERALTPEGLAMMRQQATALARIGWPIEHVLCSTFTRARQTAELVGQAYGRAPQPDATLRPGASLEALEAAIAPYIPCEHLFVVAHQPSVGQWVRTLCGATAVIRPGTLVHIEARRLRPLSGLLHGFYAPEVLARLGADPVRR